METINQRLEQAIKAIGLTKTAVAKTLNVSPSFVSLICKGGSGISDRTISDFCDAYDVSEPWLRDGIGEMFVDVPRPEAVARYMAQVLAGKRSRAEEALISFMANTSAEEWELLDKLLDRLIQEKKNTDTD